MPRDHAYERDFLQAVAREAKLVGLTESFTTAALNRLEKGAAEYGDNFMEKGRDLLAEAREEAVDLPAWALLFLQWLREQQRTEAVDEEVAHHAAILTLAAAASSLRAWYYLAQARDLLGA